MSSINDLPAFPPPNFTKEDAKKLLIEIEKAKNPLKSFIEKEMGENEQH